MDKELPRWQCFRHPDRNLEAQPRPCKIMSGSAGYLGVHVHTLKG